MVADCDEVLLGRDELQCAWTGRATGRRTGVYGAGPPPPIPRAGGCVTRLSIACQPRGADAAIGG